MALLYRTELRPSKLELLAAWAPSQPWFIGDADAPLVQVGHFRFDDPEGEVGVETLLVRAGDGPVLQIPLTYRNEPLPGAESALIGTMEHGVLGTRWTYDALADPVYRGELARAILTGGTQVEMWVEVDGVMTQREPTAHVVGTGTLVDPDLAGFSVSIVRVPGTEKVDGPLLLNGTWNDHPEPLVFGWAAAG
jgi:Maltokinase N-terminal cap domain